MNDDLKSPKPPENKIIDINGNGKISSPVLNKLIKYQFIYSILGLVIGIVFSVLGVILLLHALSSDKQNGYAFKLLGMEVSDAPPGIVLFIIGLVIVYISRFDFHQTSGKQ